MRRLVLLVIAACSSPPAAQPAPGAPPAPVIASPPPVIADAPPADDPQRKCAAATLPAANRHDPQRASLEGACQLRKVDTENPEPGLTAILGRAPRRDEDRVVAFEAGTRARFDALVACNDKPPRIDYQRQHVWLVVVRGMGTEGSVSGIYDDGATATLVVGSSSRAGCGGRAYGYEMHLDAVLVPADRKVEVMSCENDLHCTGREK